ncbi:type II toxin-antitoxin system PemK/MazF family toxin [Viridibacillus arvi]|uniref:type II toxin-antitoxin system PemK/MazF family toxin n=1 Tax=Viridibacillus arvi TaxID=263475 RepID=UPI003D036C18
MLEKLSDILNDIKILPVNEQQQLFLHFQSILGDNNLKKIMNNIADIQDEPAVPSRTRTNTLERIERYTNSAKRKHEFHHSKSDAYLPIVDDGELIYIEFSGLGSEIDENHYGIVWQSFRRKDTLVIIPTTSFKEESTRENGSVFNIGNVAFMNKESVVLLDQITNISRKKIDRSKRHLTRQTIGKHPNGKPKHMFAKISPEQQERIKDGFRVHFLKEKTLYDLLLLNYKDKMPYISEYNVQIRHMYRPIVINEKSTPDVLFYSLYEDLEKLYTIPLFEYIGTLENRNIVFNNWVHAKADFDPVNEQVLKSRTDVQKEKFEDMKTLMVLSKSSKSSVTN